jgi:hypothetical protein
MLATIRSVKGVMLMVLPTSALVAAETRATSRPPTVPAARNRKGAVMPGDVDAVAAVEADIDGFLGAEAVLDRDLADDRRAGRGGAGDDA